MLFVFSVDPTLGKVDKHLLSQETLLELLIGDITKNKEEICGSQENPKDILQWHRVNLNASKEVIEIDWSFMELEGSIDLKWFPLALKEFFLQRNRLTGTADLTCLPEALEALSLSENLFYGTIDLTHLPSGLIRLWLYNNNFSGKTDFSALPGSLISLSVSDTQLEGEVFQLNGYLKVDGSNVKDMRKKRSIR